MKTILVYFLPRRLSLAWALTLFMGVGHAAPGAHGPDGEHLDAPQVASAASSAPRLEATSELFELVARLQGGEFSILIDRFATNEPVLNAQVEVESGPLKAKARFHQDLGDYAVDDPAMLKLLATPGEHPVVITILAGDETDLLDGLLQVGAGQIPQAAAHGHSHGGDEGGHGHAHSDGWWRWAVGAVIVMGVVIGWTWRRRQKMAIHAVSHLPLLLVGLSFVFSAAQAAPGAHGPDGEHLDQAAAPSRAGLARLPDGSVQVPKQAQRRMGLRTLIAPESQAAATVQIPGRVVADPNASGLVQSAHGGRIEAGPRGLPVAGQAVRQGDVLAWVRHHAEPYAEAAQLTQRTELRAARELAEQRVRRLASLEGTVPRKDIEAARIEARSLAARERSIGASLAAREALLAPVSGVIARADLKAGQIVDSREVLAEVVDPSRMLVEAVTPDVQLGGQLEQASLAGVEGVRLQLIGAARALRDGVLPLTFRAHVPPGTLLAVGQPVLVTAALKARRKGIVLPAEAIVRSPSNETVVWIKSGTERFVPQPVRIQPLDTHTVLVIQGLAADNRVVVKGAALVAQIR